MSSKVSITVTVSPYWADVVIACAEMVQNDPPIMDGYTLRSLADRLWALSIIPGSRSPNGAAPDAHPEFMPRSFDDDKDSLIEAYQWRMVARRLHQTAAYIDTHLDKLGIERLANDE